MAIVVLITIGCGGIIGLIMCRAWKAEKIRKARIMTTTTMRLDRASWKTGPKEDLPED